MFPASEKKRVGKSELGQKLVWCPFAKIVEPAMPTQGPYPDLHPKGVVVHYTAATHGGPDEISYGRKMGYAYMVIDRAGQLFQSHPLSRWGYHAGESSWPGLGSGVSRNLVGVEIESWGLLTPTPQGPKAWSGQLIPQTECRTVSIQMNNQKPGLYQVFTPAQEKALRQLCLWLKANAPDIFDLNLVVGHDEVAPNRKEDPGGSLSVTMPAFRTSLLKEWPSGPTVG